jgi:hypothetical protein
MQDVTNPKCRYEETCFYPAHEEMPKEEQIATALLQLKNNPTLFDGWAAHNGAIKADGHFLLQNHLDDLPHPLPNRCLQPFSQRTLLAHFHCSASLRHGVFLLCPEPPAKRFRAFSFTDFSGEYAFYFSTGILTARLSSCLIAVGASAKKNEKNKLVAQADSAPS